MNEKDSSINGYLVAAALGAIGGAVIVAIATKAIPKMISKMMAGMAHRRDGHFDSMDI